MDEWNIYPSTVTLQPPHLSSVAVLLRTSGVHKHPFEAVVLEHPPGFILSVNPSAGFIPTSDGVELTIMCSCTDTLRTSHPNLWKGVVKVQYAGPCNFIYKESTINLKLEVLVAVKMLTLVWVVMSCSLVSGYHHSTETLVTTHKIVWCYNPQDPVDNILTSISQEINSSFIF
jgi:hypothetical protein